MRIVIDTNVLVSGLLWHGAPHTLLQQIRNDATTLFTSPVLIAKLDEVLQRRKFAKALQSAGTTRKRILAELRMLADGSNPRPCRSRFVAIPMTITSLPAPLPHVPMPSSPAISTCPTWAAIRAFRSSAHVKRSP